MQIKAPAKINLFLQVLRKRKDGYHEIFTLFERIALFDTLTAEKASSDIYLTTSDPLMATGKENLVYRAAHLLKERYGVPQGVHIHLDKRIPISAGLGGGSSDAAATLLLLKRFWKLKVSKKSLLKLGAELGSDVPFFLLEATNAWGSGRGEKLKQVELPAPKRWYCLVKPPFGISTRDAYQGLSGHQLTRSKPDVRMLLRSLKQGDAKSLSRHFMNSLELVLNNRVTEIKTIHEKLIKEGSKLALLSGSGSTVFGLFSTSKEAAKAARQLAKHHKKWWVRVVSSY